MHARELAPLAIFYIIEINPVPHQANIDWRKDVPTEGRRDADGLAILVGGCWECAQRRLVAPQGRWCGRKHFTKYHHASGGCCFRPHLNELRYLTCLTRRGGALPSPIRTLGTCLTRRGGALPSPIRTLGTCLTRRG